jgi:hypothetical protein
MSHRVAGPIYRFRKTFEAGERGDFRRDVILRDGDLMMDLASSYNRMAGGVRADLSFLKEQTRLIVEGCRRDGAAETLAHAEEMAACLEQYVLDDRTPEPAASEEAPETADETVETSPAP